VLPWSIPGSAVASKPIDYTGLGGAP